MASSQLQQLKQQQQVLVAREQRLKYLHQQQAVHHASNGPKHRHGNHSQLNESRLRELRPIRTDSCSSNINNKTLGN